MVYFPPSVKDRMFLPQDYGAVGDGITDDSDALQACIEAALTQGSRYTAQGIVFLPHGTYLVTKQIAGRIMAQIGGFSDGWRAGCFIWGERPDTTIRLAPNSPGFNNVSSPRAVLKVASEEPNTNSNPDGKGNQGFRHYLRNFTVSVGAGNPGADGISYLAHNRGAMLDITVIDEANTARTGIDLTVQSAGPALIKRCKIVGFNRGTHYDEADYHMTVEDCEFRNQRSFAIDIRNSGAALRKINSYNNVPVLRVSEAFATVSITESNFYNPTNTIGTTAISVTGNVIVTACKNFSAYTNTIVNTQGTRTETVTDREIYDWSSQSARFCFQSRSPAYLGIVPKETPEFDSDSPDDFAVVDDYGAQRSSSFNSTAAIQLAANSGKPILVFPRGSYYLASPVVIPPTVKKVLGGVVFMGRFQSYTGPLFTTQQSEDPLIFEHISFDRLGRTSDVDLISCQISNRPVAMKYCDIGELSDTEDSLLVDVWTEDTIGPVVLQSPKRYWGRQINVEYNYVKPALQLRGGTGWILGYKTEGNSVVIDADSTAVQCFSTAFYPLRAGTVPLIKLNNCPNTHIQYRTVGVNYYRTLIEETQKGVTRAVTATSVTSGIYSGRYQQ